MSEIHLILTPGNFTVTMTGPELATVNLEMESNCVDLGLTYSTNLHVEV